MRAAPPGQATVAVRETPRPGGPPTAIPARGISLVRLDKPGSLVSAHGSTNREKEKKMKQLKSMYMDAVSKIKESAVWYNMHVSRPALQMA